MGFYLNKIYPLRLILLKVYLQITCLPTIEEIEKVSLSTHQDQRNFLVEPVTEEIDHEVNLLKRVATEQEVDLLSRVATEMTVAPAVVMVITNQTEMEDIVLVMSKLKKRKILMRDRKRPVSEGLRENLIE